MDPGVEAADQKIENAEQIEQTATELRGDGTSDAAVELETTASNLRTEAETERANAQAQADQEKSEVDEKYGT